MGNKIESLIKEMGIAYQKYLEINSLSMRTIVKTLMTNQFLILENLHNTTRPKAFLMLITLKYLWTIFFNGFNNDDFDMRKYTSSDENSANKFNASCFDFVFLYL